MENSNGVVFNRGRFVVRIAQEKMLVADKLICRGVPAVFSSFVVFHRHLKRVKRAGFTNKYLSKGEGKSTRPINQSADTWKMAINCLINCKTAVSILRIWKNWKIDESIVFVLKVLTYMHRVNFWWECLSHSWLGLLLLPEARIRTAWIGPYRHSSPV